MQAIPQPEQSISFRVMYQIPVSVNHYKEPCRYTGKDGKYHLGFRVSRAARAYYDAVAIFSRGRTVAPADRRAREKITYDVEVRIMLGKRQRGDDDNFSKCSLDALVHAGVIHSDAAVRSPRIIVDRDHRDDPDSPCTIYTVTRMEGGKRGTTR